MALRKKYAPGSFTKNFAWADTGFNRLHTVIRAGYGSVLNPVQRNKWRADSGINDASLELIPINFFLHNKDGRMSVDELVFQGIQRPHTIDFDRLALFAFHLNQVGKPPGQAIRRPALWANEFAKEVLWRRDNWQSAALNQQALDDFIATTMNANEQVRIKSRNNYRYFFELAGYLPASTPTINTGSESWIASALYLTWDRYLLDGGKKTEDRLLERVDIEDLHKLVGVSKSSMLDSAKAAAPVYLAAGALERFTTPSAVAPSIIPSIASVPAATAPAALWLDEDGSDDAVSRSLGSKLVQKRNRKLAAELRLHYKHKCMFCGIRLQIGDQRFYAEAAHIKPLGLPHTGPDKTGNILVLCPNHHLQFDRGMLRLVADGANFKIKSSVPSDDLHDKLIKPRHSLDDDCVKWHHEWFRDKR
jgi:HNH endonuclease